MKNVTPAAGQVWEHKITKMPYPIDEANIDYIDPYQLHLRYTFIPQNDLEWLAVNEPEWFHDDCRYIRRDGERAMYCDVLSYYHNNRLTCYTRVELQNMRYELYPDEKPTGTDFEAFAKGLGIAPSINFNCPCTTAPLKKETKMIDLSPFKIGDEFVLNNGYIVSLFARTKMNSICQLQSGHLMLYTHDGKIDEMVNPGDDGENWRIMAKHDPRHWLKDLPDADLFNGRFTWVAYCDEFNDWMAYESEPCSDHTRAVAGGNVHGIVVFKMPTLTGDEWKLSKISIPDLKAWQEQNK